MRVGRVLWSRRSETASERERALDGCVLVSLGTLAIATAKAFHHQSGTRKSIRNSNGFHCPTQRRVNRESTNFPTAPVPPVPAYSVRTDIATRLVFASSAELPHVSYTNHRPDPCQQPCLRARERRRRPRLSCRVMRRDYEATETRSYRQLFHPRIPFLRRA